MLVASPNRGGRLGRAGDSVAELELRFDFEEEWLKAGKPLRTKAFFYALKERLNEETLM